MEPEILEDNAPPIANEGDAPAVEAPVAIEQVATTTTATYEQINGVRQYPSLYDSYGSTMIAIVFAVAIVTAVIGIVQYIYRKAASDHSALTQFVTTMFALIAGIFVADKIVAGPSTQLLHGQESLKILEFIQQTCLMVFAYYFGTKAQPPKDGPLHKEE
jgi:hypothetical protein